jgi:hypothetical protein
MAVGVYWPASGISDAVANGQTRSGHGGFVPEAKVDLSDMIRWLGRAVWYKCTMPPSPTPSSHLTQSAP